MNNKYFALTLAEEQFEGKVDLAGEPYIKHLERVAADFWHEDTLYCIAILHDIVEDCPEWSIERLRNHFTESVCDAIGALTKRKGEQYDTYIERVMADNLARLVKIEDLRDNMNITRIKRPLTQKDIDRMVKYHAAYLKLSNATP